ncbi:MAG: hypothetical protein IIZ78_01360 [Clostridiales bacterium]|nr:hypothetical protein [Clostridiales bacterium]
MTRAEAIKILINYGENNIIARTRVGMAFDMAIKSLETDEAYQLEYEKSTTKNDLGVDREDAVERLNAIKQLIGYDKDSEIVKATQKSLDMAIKALEHPEKNVVAVVPCGDCISREQALKELKESAEYHANDSREEALLRRDRDIIRALPSVTPQEPKTGHWIPSHIPESILDECSECGFSCGAFTFNYCPNCGAKMESEDKE